MNEETKPRRRRLTPPFEADTAEPRILVMEYTVRCRTTVQVDAGPGGVSRAVVTAALSVGGMRDVDPRSIRYTLEDRPR